MNKTIMGLLIVSTSLMGLTTYFDVSASHQDDNVGFQSSDIATPAFNPVQPDSSVDVIDSHTAKIAVIHDTSGPLSIDFASSIYFEGPDVTTRRTSYPAVAQEIISQDATHQFVPDFIQISDLRGSRAGWTLQVAQNGQFKSTTQSTKNEASLKGAEVALKDSHSTAHTFSFAPKTREANLNPDGDAAIVMSAGEGTGNGTWLMLWGRPLDQNNNNLNTYKNKSISLSVPQGADNNQGVYATTLTWTLINVPV